MRYHKAGNTLAMLMDPAIPRRRDGALNVCHECQRWMWFSGGFLQMLTRSLEASARVVEMLHKGFKTRVENLAIGEQVQTRTSHREAAAGIVERIADAKGWALRCQRRTDGRVIVVRLPHPDDDPQGFASGMEAPLGGETPKSGSTEGDSPTGAAGNAQKEDK
jgi:hypothetical protein